MLNKFEFGPVNRIELALKGEVEFAYGSYKRLPENIQDALQLLCHAVIQVSDIVERSEGGILWVGSGLMIVCIAADVYYIGNIVTNAAVINLKKEGDGFYSTDFFSIKQLALTDPILSLAYENARINGRHQ